ncbi:glycosyltransferase family 2 protein [Sphingobacterium bambusae]|uniref:Glycosyltransferase family 2 protein n=1 Tax=Sphingobacterium bambusae TaxID=662858 RepID=A0ABW6BID3_9SPHI|nr:glycosyltransferase family 2 protein [Sphingobacterium bambusae]WPL47381.1 glycosyltransferase family 2 protein [Sphingobacterium bambusae]
MTKRKYIAFSLWGNSALYTIGAIRNAQLLPSIYPDWKMVVYHDDTVPKEILLELRENNVELICIEDKNVHPLFLRFFIADRGDCGVAIFRDADSRITLREALAVKEWIEEDTVLHVMRDHPYHQIPFGAVKTGILGGMWGIKGGTLKMEESIRAFVADKREQAYGIDQAFLASVYEQYQKNSTTHDEFFSTKKFPIPRDGEQFVGERIDEHEEPVGDDRAVIAEYYKQHSSVFFTIIIPAYCAEKTIERCVNSILMQSFSDFEIIIQDGNSSDRTVDVIKQLKDTRIKIFSEADSGVYDAMNKALDRSGGEWIYFLGSDDLLFDGDVLKEMNNQLVGNQAKLVYGDVLMLDRNVEADKGYVYMGAVSKAMLIEKNICHQSIFYHKSIFESGYRYNTKYRIFADYDANLYLSSRYETKYVPLTVAKFYLGGLSSTEQDVDFDRDKWRNIIRYYGSQLRSKAFRKYRYQIKEAAVEFLKKGQLSYFFLAYLIFVDLKLFKKR